MEPYIWPIASVTQMTSVWTIVLITVDRYTALCTPLSKTRQFIETHAKKFMFAIPILSIFYNVPRFFEYSVGKKYYNICRGSYQLKAIPTPMRLSQTYFISYKFVGFFLIRMLIPLATIVVLNIKLIINLRNAKKGRKMLTTCLNRRQEDSFTPIFVAVIVVFLLCNIPNSQSNGGFNLSETRL